MQKLNVRIIHHQMAIWVLGFYLDGQTQLQGSTNC
jgi:hypothetical protein